LLSGWITVFSFFDKDGQKMAKDPDSNFEDPLTPEGLPESRRDFPTVYMDDINANVLSCPAIVDDNGVKYNATLFVGQMSFAYEPVVSGSPEASALRSNHQGMVVKPRNDWALVIEEGKAELDRPTEADADFPPPGVDICYWYEHLELPKDLLGSAYNQFPKDTDPSSSSSLDDDAAPPTCISQINYYLLAILSSAHLFSLI
jgi:hypothetical protein